MKVDVLLRCLMQAGHQLQAELTLCNSHTYAHAMVVRGILRERCTLRPYEDFPAQAQAVTQEHVIDTGAVTPGLEGIKLSTGNAGKVIIVQHLIQRLCAALGAHPSFMADFLIEVACDAKFRSNFARSRGAPLLGLGSECNDKGRGASERRMARIATPWKHGAEHPQLCAIRVLNESAGSAIDFLRHFVRAARNARASPDCHPAPNGAIRFHA